MLKLIKMCFLIEKFDVDKNFDLYDRFLHEIKLCCLICKRCLKFKFFSKILKYQVLGLISLKCLVPGFSRIAGFFGNPVYI